MQIIPAIDIIDGKCVRLTEGKFDVLTEYTVSPIEIAKQYEDIGITRLHLVDLDGAMTGVVKNWQILEQLSSQTRLIIDFGGGVKTREDVKRIFDMGVSYATVGSIAAKHPDTFFACLNEFGADRFLLGADVKNNKIMISGWQEQLELDIITFLSSHVQKGMKNAFCTDVSKDGKLQGPSIELYTQIINSIPELSLIASGGVSSMEDIMALQAIGCSGVIVGKAIYENRISLLQIKEYLTTNSI
jgi:phosphoribosylformimino-5-aminoimidazole carboxamide ribotide isomerase